jgi:hypothetical protein
MTEPSTESIADVPAATASCDGAADSLALWLAMIAGVWGIIAAFVYFHEGLTLSHYDAKGHLVVARRVIDSLTPGWQQIGAVWLPLPHVLNLFPVQIDLFYRTGASGVAISIASFVLAIYSSARLVLASTGSRVAAVFTSLLLATNPNILYLQSTPMTEPLLLGLLALGVALVYEGVAKDDVRRRRWGFLALALACLTRYEAWPVTGAAVIVTALAGWRRHGSAVTAVRDALQLALIPATAIGWFFVHSRVTVGHWFVTDGFYVVDPQYQGKPLVVTTAVGWGIQSLGSITLAIGAAAAVVVLFVLWCLRRDRSALIVPLAWVGIIALAWYAFFQGHPFRIRYMVPAVAASSVLLGIGVGHLRRWQVPAALVLLTGVWWQARPFDPKAAMVLEAQWDRPRGQQRRAVTACLPHPGHGEIVMASMGALAHYMQELSAEGFALRDFLHEGNGDLWAAGLVHPASQVRWRLIEEVSVGGDMLADRARHDPTFLAGFTRVCEGGGVALYRSAKWEVQSAKQSGK